jgi:DHA1 family bicyclomycin/chloramphenicol resistance-like MFS transporter
MSTLHRTALPLASLTALGLLASDLYLPALPAMAGELQASIAAGQATMAVFMVALAVSQLAWGWAADHFGDRATILLGSALLAGGSLLCALAGGIDAMLAGRLLQGLGAGAATVAVPALIRRRFSETDAVGALAMVAIAESAIPAAAPVAGAAIVMFTDWRLTFWIIAVLALLLMPVVSRIVGPRAAAGSRNGACHGTAPADAAADAGTAPGAATSAGSGAGPGATASVASTASAVPAASASAASETALQAALGLLGNGPFLRYACSYALMFGALLMFVASAPQLVTGWLGREIGAFAVLQICGVAMFMAGATRGAKLVRRHGVAALLRAGMLMQALSGAGMLACALADWRSLPALIALWSLFCCGLGVRGPSTMSRALSLSGAHAGKAAGLLMFLAFAMTSGATMAAAPLLHLGLLPVAALLTALAVLSAALLPEALRRP